MDIQPGSDLAQPCGRNLDPRRTRSQSAGDYIARSGNPVAVAIVACTWVQVPLVVGIVLTAVADALIVDAPLGPSALAVALLICGGPAVFLIGTLLFHRSISRTWIPWRMASVAAVAVIFASHPYSSPLALSWLTNAALLSAAVFDVRAPRQPYQTPQAVNRSHHSIRRHAPKRGAETRDGAGLCVARGAPPPKPLNPPPTRLHRPRGSQAPPATTVKGT